MPMEDTPRYEPPVQMTGEELAKIIMNVRNMALDLAIERLGQNLGTYVDIKIAQQQLRDLKK